MSGTPSTGDKWFAMAISMLIVLASILVAALLFSLEVAIWDAGFGNFLFWHALFASVGTIAYKFVYKRVLRSLP